MSTQAKGLFGMSMILSSFTSIMGLMILLGKWALLRNIDKADQEVRRKSAVVDIESVYKNDNDGDDNILQSVSYSGENPMHEAALNMIEQQKEELVAKEMELDEKRKEIEQLRRQL
jgi:hypothetical protein